MRRSTAALALAAMLLAQGAAAADAPAASRAPVSVTGAWVRWLPSDLPAAGYATLRNDGAKPLRLTGATSPDYARVMLHRSVSENGVERMVMTPGIDIAPGATVSLAPGGYHLMLMHAKHAIRPGDRVTLDLVFDGGATFDVEAPVKPASATGAD